MTTPRLTVKDRITKAPWGEVFPGVLPENVRKVSHGVVLMGPDYRSSVLNELAREGKPKSEAQFGESWHEEVPGSWCLRRNKRNPEDLYLWVSHPLKVKRGDTWIHVKSKSRVVDISTGKELPREKIVNFLPLDNTPKNQGVEEGREVIVRTYKLSSIRSITLDGVHYTVATK